MTYVGNGTRRKTAVIKHNRTWKISSLPGYSLASHCTTDRLQVSLRTVTFCHGVLRLACFITAHYISHFHRDYRGRFLNRQKICHSVHGYPGVLRLPIPFPCVASRLSRFDHGCLKCGHRDRPEHSVTQYYYLSKMRYNNLFFFIIYITMVMSCTLQLTIKMA